MEANRKVGYSCICSPRKSLCFMSFLFMSCQGKGEGSVSGSPSLSVARVSLKPLPLTHSWENIIQPYNPRKYFGHHRYAPTRSENVAAVFTAPSVCTHMVRSEASASLRGSTRWKRLEIKCAHSTSLHWRQTLLGFPWPHGEGSQTYLSWEQMCLLHWSYSI